MGAKKLRIEGVKFEILTEETTETKTEEEKRGNQKRKEKRARDENEGERRRKELRILEGHPPPTKEQQQEANTTVAEIPGKKEEKYKNIEKLQATNLNRVGTRTLKKLAPLILTTKEVKKTTRGNDKRPKERWEKSEQIKKEKRPIYICSIEDCETTRSTYTAIKKHEEECKKT